MNKTLRKAIQIGKQIEEKKFKCPACNGSGYYDAKGSPKCEACRGTGYSVEGKQK